MHQKKINISELPRAKLEFNKFITAETFPILCGSRDKLRSEAHADSTLFFKAGQVEIKDVRFPGKIFLIGEE